ncbi:hypothetical protein [Pseudoxanthomonas suwonensis]|jgi:hypothetical protein|uniref:hypothetical protein n=1 Tax=Pseudoxanthomonas suwonensis TaxID=314722 RepID=UPI000464CCB9|nr:hypothetical protein [Pseudoxanthomonas suwonensis]
MRFELLRQRVERAERRVAACSDRAEASRSTFATAWKRGWTPPRIVIAGLVSGFLVGRAEPLSRVGAARWLQMAGTISSMLATLRAAAASEEAGAAADEAAQQAASVNQGVAEATGQEPAVPPENAFDPQAGAAPVRAPSPAEAATELSER